jgi:peptidyl-prolyl cis-trans isomerase SurA
MIQRIYTTHIKRHILLPVAVLTILTAWYSGDSAIGAEVIDRIVAIVNNDLISLEDLNNQIKPYLEKIYTMGYPPDKERQMISKVREDVLGQMIDQKLTDQEIARYKITASEKEVDAAIDRIKQVNSFTDETFRQALAKEGITYEDYRKRTKEQILRATLVNREIKSKVVITKEDIKAYYDAHPEQYGLDEKYHLANVMIKYTDKTDAAIRIQIKLKLQEILLDLKEGKSIDDVIRMYSSDTLKVLGGDLGTFSASTLDPKIRQSLTDLQPGQYSGVIETDYGPQIFRLLDKVNAAGKTVEDAGAQIENKLYRDIVDQKFAKWLEELRSSSYIKIML